MHHFVFGDLHGHILALDVILEDIQPTLEDCLTFLGDYIDHGPASAEVLDRLMELPGQFRTLMGNHESMLLGAMTDREVEREWIRYGGQQTLNSLGVSSAGAIQDKYIEWLHALPLYLEDPGYLFVHAGIRPDQQIALQPEQVLLWGHQAEPTLYPDKTLVCGHSPTVITPRYINLDTGIANNGYLTCLDLPGGEIVQADVLGKRQHPSFVKAA